MKWSNIAEPSLTAIRIRGYDLVDDLMGNRDFVDLAVLEMTGEFPSPSAKQMINAMMVTVAEHGMTPSVMAARLTYYTAPEAFQGAVASGLLGAGTVLLGAMEAAAALFAKAVLKHGLEAHSRQDQFDDVADQLVSQNVSQKTRLPGFGHPIHIEYDPRSAKLISLAQQNYCYGPHLRLAQAISAVAQGRFPKPMPLNAAGAIGAVTMDLGFQPVMAKAFTLIARTAGLAAHLIEEQRAPVAKRIWQSVDESVM